jgi:hypothetical protein
MSPPSLQGAIEAFMEEAEGLDRRGDAMGAKDSALQAYRIAERYLYCVHHRLGACLWFAAQRCLDLKVCAVSS